MGYYGAPSAASYNMQVPSKGNLVRSIGAGLGSAVQGVGTAVQQSQNKKLMDGYRTNAINHLKATITPDEQKKLGITDVTVLIPAPGPEESPTTYQAKITDIYLKLMPSVASVRKDLETRAEQAEVGGVVKEAALGTETGAIPESTIQGPSQTVQGTSLQGPVQPGQPALGSTPSYQVPGPTMKVFGAEATPAQQASGLGEYYERAAGGLTSEQAGNKDVWGTVAAGGQGLGFNEKLEFQKDKAAQTKSYQDMLISVREGSAADLDSFRKASIEQRKKEHVDKMALAKARLQLLGNEKMQKDGETKIGLVLSQAKYIDDLTKKDTDQLAKLQEDIGDYDKSSYVDSNKESYNKTWFRLQNHEAQSQAMDDLMYQISSAPDAWDDMKIRKEVLRIKGTQFVNDPYGQIPLLQQVQTYPPKPVAPALGGAVPSPAPAQPAPAAAPTSPTSTGNAYLDEVRRRRAMRQ